MNPRMKFKNELVVITGASGGIGKALCLEFLSLGATVLALDLDSKNLSDELNAFKDQFFFQKLDVTEEKNFNSIAEFINNNLKINPYVWINNAGIAKVDHFENISSEEFDQVLKVNFHGVVYGTRLALKLMKNPERGHLVNISSVNGALAAPFMSPYVASKHAVDGFTRSLLLEKEFSHSALSVHLVSPGFARTGIMPSTGAFTLPKQLDFLIEETKIVAEQIISGIVDGQSEIRPTFHGKVLLKFSRFLPGTTRLALRAVASKNWKEVLGLSPIKSR